MLANTPQVIFSSKPNSNYSEPLIPKFDFAVLQADNMAEDGEKEVLLEITEEHLNSGLRGVPVGTCRTSYVTPEGGVHYSGYPIAEIADRDPEDIIFLLHHKRIPSPEEA